MSHDFWRRLVGAVMLTVPMKLVQATLFKPTLSLLGVEVELDPALPWLPTPVVHMPGSYYTVIKRRKK